MRYDPVFFKLKFLIDPTLFKLFNGIKSMVEKDSYSDTIGTTFQCIIMHQ